VLQILTDKQSKLIQEQQALIDCLMMKQELELDRLVNNDNKDLIQLYEEACENRRKQYELVDRLRKELVPFSELRKHQTQNTE
jgi:molybdenum cofactor biosynthesis enzyme MoaA